MQQEDISHGRDLRSALTIEGILTALCGYYNISQEELIDNNDERRNIAIYLLKRHTGLTNKQIGQRFRDLSYSGVSKAYQRFAERLERERKLKRDIKKIAALLSNVNGLTTTAHICR